jgi:hypothetical protein
MELKQPIRQLNEEIIRLCDPRKILLFSEKQNPCGELSSVKFCVIIASGDPHKVEHHLYVEVDSPVPYDVLVYTTEEWEKLLNIKMSFASHIQRTGRVLYEAD